MGIDRYSINFKQKDGSYVGYTFSRIDPMSAVLSMAADYAYYAQNSDSANLVDLENVFKAGTLGWLLNTLLICLSYKVYQN